MKKTAFVLSSFLFFLCLLMSASVFFSKQKSYASIFEQRVFKIEFEGQKFEFLSDELLQNKKFSTERLKILKIKNKSEAIKKLKNMGLSSKEAINYALPECEEVLKKLKKAINLSPVSNNLKVVKNSCEIKFVDGKSGRFVDEIDFYKKIENEIKKNKNTISFSVSSKEYENNNFKKSEIKEKSCFSTSFSSSGEARKNNIKTALSVFDGLILEDGEILSFNSVTGERNQKNGYKQAKIISGGTFVEGFGGGVCQVSTTLYNACLLAGLEIVEVNSHSLPVSYVEPSFDAMVNTGSSDLVIRNNSGGVIVFTTSSQNNICKVKIFGKPNKYKITRFSEKTKLLPAEPEEIVTDGKKFGNLNLEIGEEKRISFAKDGFCSNGYLNFYDTKGNLVETKKIRSNKYNPTKGIVVRREN